MTCGGPLGERRPPLTVAHLHVALTKLMEQRPEWGDLPVHLLNMEPDDEDDARTGLLNHLETDTFSEEQGRILSLVSGDTFHWRQCAKPIPGSWENRMACCRHAGHEGACSQQSEAPVSA